jgi:transcriptional regulator with XRE-family HTH domain
MPKYLGTIEGRLPPYALKAWREGLKMSQETLARKIGYSVSSIMSWETARSSPPLVVELALPEVEKRWRKEQGEKLVETDLRRKRAKPKDRPWEAYEYRLYLDGEVFEADTPRRAGLPYYMVLIDPYEAPNAAWWSHHLGSGHCARPGRYDPSDWTIRQDDDDHRIHHATRITKT